MLIADHTPCKIRYRIVPPQTSALTVKFYFDLANDERDSDLEILDSAFNHNFCPVQRCRVVLRLLGAFLADRAAAV